MSSSRVKPIEAGYMYFLRFYRKYHTFLTPLHTVQKGTQEWNKLSHEKKSMYIKKALNEKSVGECESWLLRDRHKHSYCFFRLVHLLPDSKSFAQRKKAKSKCRKCKQSKN